MPVATIIPPELSETEEQLHDQAVHLIWSTLHPVDIMRITRIRSAHAIWCRLEAVHNIKTEAKCSLIKEQFWSFKAPDEMGLSDYLDACMSQWMELACTEAHTTDDDLVTALIS